MRTKRSFEIEGIPGNKLRWSDRHLMTARQLYDYEFRLHRMRETKRRVRDVMEASEQPAAAKNAYISWYEKDAPPRTPYEQRKIREDLRFKMIWLDVAQEVARSNLNEGGLFLRMR